MLVIETFPCLFAVSKEGLTAHVVRLNFLKRSCQFVKVKADLPMDLTTIYQNDELWLNPCIEVKFDFWLIITVNSDMVKMWVFFANSFVVCFYFSTHWIPLCCKV